MLLLAGFPEEGYVSNLKKPVTDFLKEIRITLALGVPMIMGQMGQMLLHIIDAIMIGRLGVLPLAAAAFGGNLIGFILVIGYGLSAAVSILVARSFGRGNLAQCGEILRHGIFVISLYALIWAAVAQFGSNIFYWFGQPEEVVEASLGYVQMLGWSLVPSLIYACLRSYSEALNRSWIPFMVLLSGLAINVFLNWIFIFGKLGSPPMGVRGAGLATLISRGSMMVILGYILIRSSGFGINLLDLKLLKMSGKLFREMLGLGIPTSFQLLFEVGMFTGAAVLMGWIGTVALAAHHITMSVAGFTFMIPLGMSFAVGIRIGHAAGREDFNAIRRIGHSSIAFSLIYMGFFGCSIFFFRDKIPFLFISEVPVILLASKLLIVVALFQIFDGVQVICMGALRGLSDVKVPTILAFCGYWLISIPVGYFFAFGLDKASLGIWVGMSLGLIFTAIVLFIRFRIVTGIPCSAAIQ